ncbi:MAG: F0F1 ATP synthase subunit epsilon [Dehalococcoidia bacterium]|nr:F0F1 ATP synthase subunit epsilon [Dehalococcoidia bacterium]
MPEIGFEIVTAERVVYSDEVDVVVAPGVEGQLAILPNHAPLMTMLQPGELMVRKAGEEESIFVSGGFLEVQGNKVIVLADTAERAEEIDTARADEARLRAEQRVAIPASEADHARAQAAMLRSLMRIKVAQKSRKRRPRG